MSTQSPDPADIRTITDHAAEALSILADAQATPIRNDTDEAMYLVAFAQVHATLAQAAAIDALREQLAAIGETVAEAVAR